MRLAVSMRTANRAPKPNYVGQTLSALQWTGADLTQVHVCASASEGEWLRREVRNLPIPVLHLSETKLPANLNGLAAVEAAIAVGAEMVLLLEDDLAFCADFLGSVSRWLDRAVRPDRYVYRCFGFTHPPEGQPAAYDWPLVSCRASQAIMLRTEDAADFVAWGRAHALDWCALAPWGRGHVALTDPTIGFDKFVATWALLRWPGVPGVMSYPYFVDHIGEHSSLHRYGLTNHRPFAGKDWAYQEAAD